MFCRIACDLPQSTLIYINFPQSTSIYFNFLSIYLNFPQFILLSYLYIPQFTFIYRDLHWFTSIYLILPQFTLIYLILHWFTPINLHLPQFTTFYLKFVISDVFLFWDFFLIFYENFWQLSTFQAHSLPGCTWLYPGTHHPSKTRTE